MVIITKSLRAERVIVMERECSDHVVNARNHKRREQMARGEHYTSAHIMIVERDRRVKRLHRRIQSR